MHLKKVIIVSKYINMQNILGKFLLMSVYIQKKITSKMQANIHHMSDCT